MAASASSWRSLGPHRLRAVFGAIMLLVAAGLGVAIPYVLGRSVDAFLVGATAEVPQLAAIIIALAVVQAACRTAGIIHVNSAARRAEHDVRQHVFEHLLATDAAYFRTQRTGDIVSRLTDDLHTVAMMWGPGVVYSVGVGSLLAFSLVVMVAIDPMLTLWALLPIPVVMLASRWLGRRLNRLGGELRATIGKLSASAHEDLAGIGVVKSYHLESQRSQLFAERSRELARRAMRVQLTDGWFQPLLGTFGAVSMLIVLWVGGTAAIEGRIGLGELVQFNAYLVLLSTRVISLGHIVALFQHGSAAWQRLAAVLAREPAIADGTGPGFEAPVRGDIAIRELTIAVDGRTLVDAASLHIPAGTITALVGRVGSGKSTLLEAIPRLFDVPRGTVTVDGRDITDLPLAELRHAIAYAPQTAFLFSASIAENIAFGIDGDHDRERIAAAARAAGLEPDLAILPAGIDTEVGERGITLSGGQRQRVALARAIASQRPIVLLDDSLSAVDTETERKILDELGEALRGRTVIMISHRVAAVRRAHQIAVLDGGRIVEVGTHDELLARGGIYAEIYQAQLQERPT